jgi:hypothetical protein
MGWHRHGAGWELLFLSSDSVRLPSKSNCQLLTVWGLRAFYSVKLEDVSEKRQICIRFLFLYLYFLQLGGWRG